MALLRVLALVVVFAAIALSEPTDQEAEAFAEAAAAAGELLS